MKKNILTSLSLAAFIALTATRAFAHKEGHETQPPPPEHGHGHTTKVPGSVDNIMDEIQRQQVLLAKIVADKNLGDAHDHAFAIRDLAQALVGKVPEAKKKDVEIAAKRITDIAADIDKSAAAGAQKTTESNVKAMGGVLKTLKLVVPHGH